MATVDSSDAHVLEETLAKVDALSSQISASLGKLAKNAAQSEAAIRPIAGRTRMLATYSKNLAASHSVIEEIKNYAKLTGECEAVITAGPQTVGVDKYAEAISRLSTASDELSQSQLRKFYKVVDKTEQLARQGNGALRAYLQAILAKAYKPIDMNEYVKQGARVPNIPAEDVRPVRQLFAFFESSRALRVDSMYTDMATRHIVTSLAPLAKAASVARTSKGQYDKGSSPIVTYTNALKGFIVARFEDLNVLFPDDEALQVRLAEEIIRVCLEDFSQVATAVNNVVEGHMQSESMLIFELVHSIVLVMSTVQLTLKSVPPMLGDLMKKAKSTAGLVFVEFLKYIDTRVQGLANLPSDNGVTEATMDVMSKLRRLSEYRQSASASIENLTPASWIPKPAPAWTTVLPKPVAPISGNSADPWSIFSAYFSDAIDALILGLELKSKGLARKNTQTGLLLLLNLTFVETSVKKSDMYIVLGSSGADRIQRLRKHAHNLFLEGWKVAAAHLMDVTVVRPGTKQLSSKDRDTIKEKFKAFNAEFESLVQKQKSYSITDPVLRQELAKEISFISPLYHRFYDKHRGGDFSKNVDKYIKYSKEQFDSTLASLG